MGLRERLREATRDEHRSLEALLGLGNPALSLARYSDYLRLTHAFYRQVEPRLASAPMLRGLGLDMPSRAKAPWLEDDLAFFDVAPLPAAPHGPDLGSGDGLIGCAYVLEGATLGGQVLRRQLAPRWGLEPGRGGTFLEGYGPRTGTMWRGFVEALEGAARSGVDEAACIAGARGTFSGLGGWFRRHGWR